MTDRSKIEALGCARAVADVHRRLDGETLDRASAERLDRHLAQCSACRERARELEELQRMLQALPAIPLRGEALERVWDRTVRAPRARGWFDWRGAAAAAVLTALLGGLWYTVRPPSPARGPATDEVLSAAELARGAAEARYALSLASAALRRSERAAIGEVLGQRVAPALSKVPIEWPSAPVPAGAPRPKGNDDA